MTEGDEVEFELSENPNNGRLCAARVRVLHPITNPSAAHPAGSAPPLMHRAPPAAYQPRVYQGEVHSALPPRGFIMVNRAGQAAQNRVPFELKENMAQRPLIMKDKVVFQYVSHHFSSSMAHFFGFFVLFLSLCLSLLSLSLSLSLCSLTLPSLIVIPAHAFIHLVKLHALSDQALTKRLTGRTCHFDLPGGLGGRQDCMGE
jgi:hypothetical protein